MNISRAKRIFIRGLKLQCPNCGLAPLYYSPFRMSDYCRYCDITFEREQGYFVGAIYINVIATEAILLITVMGYGLITGSLDGRIFSALIVLAGVLPVFFYHHSRSLWLSIDHILNPEKILSPEFK
jgi:uncharacterized protein (DUF983 family)